MRLLPRHKQKAILTQRRKGRRKETEGFASLRVCASVFPGECSPFLSPRTFAQRDLTRYVNPFIGTAGHGHTFPGAIVPFGMVQLSPDTRLTGWDGCSGYHYSDSIIY